MIEEEFFECENCKKNYIKMGDVVCPNCNTNINWFDDLDGMIYDIVKLRYECSSLPKLSDFRNIYNKIKNVNHLENDVNLYDVDRDVWYDITGIIHNNLDDAISKSCNVEVSKLNIILKRKISEITKKESEMGMSKEESNLLYGKISDFFYDNLEKKEKQRKKEEELKYRNTEIFSDWIEWHTPNPILVALFSEQETNNKKQITRNK